MTTEIADATAAAIAAEVRSAAAQGRAPRVEADALADWIFVVEHLFQAGELSVVEHTVRHLNAAHPRVRFLRYLACVFDQLPAADGQPPFDDKREQDLQIVRRDGADTVILLFCGFGEGLGLPLPVMHRWFGRLPAHLVYLRDSRHQFFLRGIETLGRDRHATLRELRRIVRDLGARRVLCYGCSGGVFAALHYGAALPADAVVCLAGPTNLSTEFHTHSKRGRSVERISQDARRAGLELDARRIYQAAARPPDTLFLFAADNWDDRIQAENLRDLPTVTLRAVPGTARHNLLLDLIERGEFEAVLDWLIEPRGEPAFGSLPEQESGIRRLVTLLFGAPGRV
jgi:hypothetical protein